MSLKLNSSGGGSVTLQEPTTASNFTLSLPAVAGTVQVSGNPISGTTGTFSGDLSFNSGYGSAVVAYGCRAWVNFNGTTNVGGFCTIRASGNVTSVADNGTGDYTVNFTTAMPDANYAAVSGGSTPGVRSNIVSTKYNQSASSCQVISFSTGGTVVDASEISIAVFR